MGKVLDFPGVIGSGEKRIGADLRLQALLMAEANEERAELCTKDQAPLKTLFQLNAKLLREVAR
jgi:hypothetical protein